MPEDGVTIKVKGIDEVNKALYKYSQQLGDKVVVDSLKQGARVVQRSAKSRAPVRTGRLKKSITVRKSKIYNGRRTAGKIGVYLSIRKNAFYGKFIEDGFRNKPGKRFIKGAFSATKRQAVKLTIAAVHRGAEIVKRKTGLK